ncbi:MAG: hypothetical protein AB3X44_16065 [Leptothrix sp. (in: b-proteobacteria)]
MKLLDVCTAIFLEVFGWTALVMAPIAILFAHEEDYVSVGGWADDPKAIKVKRVTLPAIFAWYDAPDDRLPGGMYEAEVLGWYQRYGWRVCSVLWMWRNRAFGLAWKFGREARSYSDVPWRFDFENRLLRGMVGWKVYRKGLNSMPLWAVPSISIRLNRGKP